MNNKTPEVESEASTKNLCKRGCGFYGSVEYNNMCSKCYQEFLKSEKSQNSKSSSATFSGKQPNQSDLLNNLNILAKSSLTCAEKATLKRKLPPSESSESLFSVSSSETESVSTSDAASVAPKASQPRVINRCLKCRKRVGLTGFQCRCEGLFCALHRYSDQHDCKFDYRKLGQDQIARENPEVRCPKIRKI